MKTNFQLITAFAAVLATLAACTDLTEVNSRIDGLEDRITAVETALPALNANISALQKLAGAGTINNVELNEGTYTISLSNGEKLTLSQGSIGIGKAPVMSLDSEGYWMADYQDGRGPQYVLNGSKKVPATGADGVTPQLGVDTEGYWTVSYDSGATFTRVLDSAGKPVKALGEEGASDSYFSSVKVEDSVLVLTMKSGQTYRIPVIPDFLFAIKGAEDIQLFEPGDVKSYEIEMKGVADVMIAKPDGWDATLSDIMLTVKAPASTKATIADSSSDVAVLAISDGGYSTIAKVRVQLTGTIQEVNPTASISVSSVTTNAIEFNVLTEDVTSWYYIFQQTAAGTPDAAAILASGTKGTSQTLSFTGLDSKVSYSLYVLPVNDTKQGTVAVSSVTTQAEPVVTYADNYTAWNEGKPIFIANEKYSKSQYGEATLITAESADTPLTALSEGVYILDCAASANFVADADGAGLVTNGNVIVIGRYAANKPLIKLKGYMNFRGIFAARDLRIDCSEAVKSYKFTFGTDTDRLHFDSCSVISYNANQTAYSVNYITRSFRLVNSDIKYNMAQGANAIGVNFSNSKKLYLLKDIVLENNIFYNPVYAYYTLLGCNTNAQLAQQEGTPGGVSISMCNNTFYNFTSSTTNGGFIFTGSADLININRNIFWTANTAGVNRCVRLLTNTLPSSYNFDENVSYGLAYPSAWRYFFDLTDYTIPRVTESPLETVDASSMTFIPTEAYEGYGAQRQ